MISLDSRGIHLTIPVGMPVLRAKSTDGQWWLTRAAWLPCTFYDSSNTGRRRSVVIVLTEVEGVYQRLTVRHSQDDSHPEQTPQSTICCYRTRRIRSGPPVLSRLASQGNLTAVGLQLEKGVGHPIRKRWCEEALIHAAVTGKDQAVKLLLDTGLEAEDRFLISQKALRYIMPFVSVPQNVVTVLVQVGLAQGNTYQAVRDILCQAPEEDSQCVVARHILLALDHQTRRAVCETFLSEHMTGRSHSDKRRHLYDSIINDPASSGCVT
ncbi:hypothetical protein QBC47DRAFT_389303 [Echria macrotheca]|uniref:Uncharacterized protein n=1 Tax=Echria macrotheca TaxID=438768 RepID=A0AAJ0B6W3_9PEZI|nr:hypothetical protein QBC47DRAFT_389303 [Echria macrotheca]